MKSLDRHRGCLLGLAVGDALGTTLEFTEPGSFEPITDMVGGGPFNLAPGQWTDDTSMALCLGESILECSGFDMADQLERYALWQETGHLSSTGECFDIGGTVFSALTQFKLTGDPLSGLILPDSAGNGSIMRLAPVPMAWSHDPREGIRLSGESSKTTHRLRICVDACRYLGALIIGALNGVDKDSLLSACYCPTENLWKDQPLDEIIGKIAAGSFKEMDPPLIRGNGYVIKSLEAALWAFYNSTSFEEGALMAVNLGEDADTTGAVYGQLAGAYYGESGIPEKWLDKVAMRETICEIAEKLAKGSKWGQFSPLTL